MKDCNKCESKIQTVELAELPIDTIEALPDFVICERDIVDPSTGKTKRTITRVPTEKLFPNGNFDNISLIDGNNPEINVPAGQVRAGYVKNEGSRNVVYYADATHPAQFLIVGKAMDGQLLIQPCGVINTMVQHRYIIGVNYYAGADGEPTTVGAQKLFIPISETKLLVTL